MSSTKRKKRSSIPLRYPSSRQEGDQHLEPSNIPPTVAEADEEETSTNVITVPKEDFSPGSIEYMRYRLSIISNTIPVPKSKLTWINLSHEYEQVRLSLFPWPSRNVMKRKVLKDLSGELRGGTMTAVLGPTEGGKTTLLKLLSGTKINGLTSGQILIL